MAQSTPAIEQSSSEKANSRGRRYGDRPSYPIYVWNGILEPKHRKNIGPALWEFLWCLDRITKEKDGIGIVLGGMPLTYQEIAESLGVSEKTVQRHIERLAWEDYLTLIRTPRGYSIRVPNSCKFVKATGQKCPVSSDGGADSAGESVGETKLSTLTGQKCPPRPDTSVHSPDKSVRSNIRESSLSNQLEKAGEKAAAAKTAPRVLPTSPFKENKTATPNPSEKETATPIPVFIAPLAKRKSIPRVSPSAVDWDERRRFLLRQREELERKYPEEFSRIPKTPTPTKPQLVETAAAATPG